MQAVAGDVTNVAREQATLHETVENRGEESVRRLETLSEDHRNVHNHLDQLGEDVKQASAEAAETVTRRVASRESFQAHAEAIEAQMSGIAAAQERLEGNVNTAKVNIEKISAEQASINGTLQDNTSTVAATMGLIEQFQQPLQGEIGSLAQASRRTIASIEEMTVEQASLREIAGRKNDELTGQIAAFSEDQKAALAAFGDDLQQTATDMASVARDQDHIENAVSSACQESLAKLDAITDDQEHRSRQLDANETRANEMLANIGNLQQQVGAVLEMLNICTQSLTDVLDSNDEQQSRLEGTINQNVTAIAELISQIQANRASLEDQM
jgi:chromosome segregation ATPase